MSPINAGLSKLSLSTQTDGELQPADDPGLKKRKKRDKSHKSGKSVSVCSGSSKRKSTDPTEHGRAVENIKLQSRPIASSRVKFPLLTEKPRYTTKLIDIGANLLGYGTPVFPDIDSVVRQAAESGVGDIVIIGATIPVSKQAQTLLSSQPDSGPEELTGAASARCSLHFMAGCHPHKASDFARDGGRPALRDVIMAANQGQCIAVGECGLDYKYLSSPEDVQKAVFREHLELAVELQKPLFLHERGAHNDFIDLLSPYIPHLPTAESACIHCFTGNWEQLQTYLDLGCSIGITGWIAGSHKSAVVAALRTAGWERLRDRLMIESDAPSLLPKYIMPTKPESQYEKNVPANLPYVCCALAWILKVDPEEVAKATTENARRIFLNVIPENGL